jgi:NAD(P)H-quinone oxidoreductase subunit N
MPLLLTGRGFRQTLEQAGALALYAPLEGGAETRLLRRLRAAGYRAHLCSARGLGDPEEFLFSLHGVRPPTWVTKASAAVPPWARSSG